MRSRESRPLAGESDRRAQSVPRRVRAAVRLDGLYGFPQWEKDVYDLYHAHHKELRLIFRRLLPVAWRACRLGAGLQRWSFDEFEDFAIDVGLPTRLKTNKGAAAAVYGLDEMKAAFAQANRSGKGAAGPAADAELEWPEFLGCLVRVSFGRLNPEFGEITMEHSETILPVPYCLERTLRECVLPKGRRDDRGAFREVIMRTPEVVSALSNARPRLEAWLRDELALPSTQPLPADVSIGMGPWIRALQRLKLLGTSSVEQTSEIVGDERLGTEVSCRLSVPRAKAAFVQAQQPSSAAAATAAGGGGEKALASLTLGLDELLECVARCAADKYRSVPGLGEGDRVTALVSNLMGEKTAEQVMLAATHVSCERFVPPIVPDGDKTQAGLDRHRQFVETWHRMPLQLLPGFPLWEGSVFAVLQRHATALRSIFNAYAASSLDGSDCDMDADEFRDVAFDCGLPTSSYGVEVMLGEFSKANAGSGDSVLVFHEFLTVLVRVSFFRANPHHGMRAGDTRRAKKNVAQKNADALGTLKPLPDCLEEMLVDCILPRARTEAHAEHFRTHILPLDEVQHALSVKQPKLHVFYEMTSAGRPYLQLDQWMGALERAFAISDLTVQVDDAGNAGGADDDGKGGDGKGGDGGSGRRPWPVRLTEPQARSAFYAAATTPSAGLLPHELAACIARCGCDKYKLVGPMGHGARVHAFLLNVLEGIDEEDAIRRALVPPPPAPPAPAPAPPPAPPPAEEAPEEPPAPAPAPAPAKPPEKRTLDRFGGIVRAGSQ